VEGRRYVLKITTAALIALAVLAGCAPFGTTRKERVQRFEVGLNENREYLYQEFYEPLTSDYATLQTSPATATWDVWFPPGFPDPGTYSVSADSYLGDFVEAVVTGPGFANPKPLRLYMVRSGLEWYIEKLVLDGTTIVN
jgi:hypothetical protein